MFAFAGSTGNDYEKIFGTDYSSAVGKMKQFDATFKKVCQEKKSNSKICKAIVFPELIRYSYLSDLFETAALEWAYVNGGSKAADFSIGHFQMKPSFVEKMEEYVKTHTTAMKVYDEITKYDSGSSVKSQRISRLKDVQWQVKYISCFYALCMEKFKSEIFKTDAEKVKFYSTAYNTGFNQTAEEIKKKFKNKFFPYGPKYADVEQYPYCDVAVYYFNKL